MGKNLGGEEEVSERPGRRLLRQRKEREVKKVGRGGNSGLGWKEVSKVVDGGCE